MIDLLTEETSVTVLEPIGNTIELHAINLDLITEPITITENIAIGPQGPPGAAATDEWGTITGTLSDQTDLQAALDAKVSKATGPTPTTLNEVISLLQTAGLCS